MLSFCIFPTVIFSYLKHFAKLTNESVLVFSSRWQAFSKLTCIFIQTSFFSQTGSRMCAFVFAALRVTLCVDDKKQKIFGTICYLMPPSPPRLLWNYEQWVALTFLRTAKWGGASAPVLGQWRTEQPCHTYTRLANDALLFGSHDAFLCAPSPHSAQSRRVQASLKIWHRQSRTSTVSGRISQVLSYANFIAVRCSCPTCRWECFAGGTDFFRFQTTGEAQGRDNNA